MGIIVARNDRRTKMRCHPHTRLNLLRLCVHDRRRIMLDEIAIVVAEALSLRRVSPELFELGRPSGRRTQALTIYAASYSLLAGPLRARFRSSVIADVLDLCVDAALLRRSMPLVCPQPVPA
jgi:hypothetical protein